MDGKPNHAINLKSGYIGRANVLTQKIAAIDMIAKAGNLYIENPQNIKHINMTFLTGESVGLYDPLSIIKNKLPKAFWTDLIDRDIAVEDTGMAKKQVFCSHRIKKVPRETLILRPPVLSVGIGCNRGTKYKDIWLLTIFSIYDNT
jgi:cobalt-precorrin 5A hydrolase